MGEAKRRQENDVTGIYPGSGGPTPIATPEPGADKPTPKPTSLHRKIMIAIPCYSGKLDANTVVFCAGASMEASKLGWETVLTTRSGDSILPRCRDVMLSQFYYSDCTDMLFLDSDISGEPGAFVRLMNHPVEMVGGIYCGRGDPPAYTCCGIRPGEINVDYPAGLGEVRGLGTGFLRITRAAVERLIRHLPENHWYHDDFTAKGLRIHHFFNFTFDFTQDPGMRLRSEDYAFCDLFREAGGKVYGDVEVRLHHAGMHSWTGHFGEFLRNGGGKDRPARDTAPGAIEAIAPGVGLTQAVEQMIAAENAPPPA